MSQEIVHHERALVGMCLIDPCVIDRVEIDLGGYSWIDEPCRHLWPILVSMRRDGEPIADVRNVAIRAKQNVSAGEIGRLVGTDAGFKGQESYHLSKLTDTMDRSRLRRVASEIVRRVDDPTDSVEALRDWIASQTAVTSASKTNTQSASHHIRKLVEQSSAPKSQSKVLTGIAGVDNCIGGLRPGQFAVIAARASIGKSAFAAQIAVDAAKSDHRVLFISLEMTALETVARLLAMELGLDTQSILNGELASHEIRSALRVADQYDSIPLLIEDRRGMNINRISSLIRSCASQQKLGLVVIDYIGLIVGDPKKKLWEAMTEVSNALKTLAQTEQVPILALCQLNREAEGNEPQLSHLRNAGAIEQDADIVFLMHRDRFENNTDLIIAKNRNGAVGKLKLEFTPERFTFRQSIGEAWTV